MDAIFGKKNFQNEIVWSYKSGGATIKRFSRKHDIVFFYSKRLSFKFNALKEKSYNRDFKPYNFKGVKEFQDNVGWYTLVNMKDVWNIDMVGRTSKERMGYPTQKPLALYERIVKASSNEGDIVLDPFCGCATTCVVAEKLNRQWVGIDIWDGTQKIVEKRMTDEVGLFGNVTFTDELPERTDEGEEAVPFLRVKEKVKEPNGKKMDKDSDV